MAKWDRAIQPACVPVLMRILAGDHEHAARAAAHMLAEFGRGDDDLKAVLLQLFHNPRSIKTMHAAFMALGQCWNMEVDVAKLALQLRRAPLADVQIDAIRIRAARNEADLEDLAIFAGLAYESEHFSSNIYERDLVEYFAVRHKELVAHIEKRLSGQASRGIKIPLLGALVLADPFHPRVDPLLREISAEDWSIRELFCQSHIPLERIAWTPELMRAVEEKIPSAQHHDYEWYWVSKVLRLESLKARMIASMKAGEGLSFWSAHGLAEFWGK
jgi:hypothetical protein